MGKMQRDKGARRERELVNIHLKNGVKAERVPLSGACKGNYGGDIDIYARGEEEAPLVFESKARGNGSGFKSLLNWLAQDDADGLFLVADRHEPLVVLPISNWLELLQKKRN